MRVCHLPSARSSLVSSKSSSQSTSSRSTKVDPSSSESARSYARIRAKWFSSPNSSPCLPPRKRYCWTAILASLLQKLADIKFIQTTALHKGKLYAITVFDPYFRKNNAHFVFSSYLLYGGRADALPRLFGALKMAFPRIRRQSPV